MTVPYLMGHVIQTAAHRHSGPPVQGFSAIRTAFEIPHSAWRGKILMDRTPTRDDKFSLVCGRWVGRPGICSVRRPGRCWGTLEAVRRLGEMDTYEITFHDDDLIPPGTGAAL